MKHKISKLLTFPFSKEKKMFLFDSCSSVEDIESNGEAIEFTIDSMFNPLEVWYSRKCINIPPTEEVIRKIGRRMLTQYTLLDIMQNKESKPLISE